MQSAMEKQRASIARQRAAVRMQAQTVGTWLAPGPEESPAVAGAPQAPCDPIADAEVAALIEGAAKAHEVQPKLLRAVIEQESGFRPCAVSAKGAQGLMQLMPATATELGVRDPFDPKENIEAGATYLKQLIDKFKGDLAQALGAFNAGPGAVDQANGIPDIPETRDYVGAILQKVKR